MKKLIAILFPTLFSLTISAQDNCYFPTRKGAELTYKYYNNRGKPLKDQWKDERWMKFVVEDVWPQEDGMIINVGISNEVIERLAKNERLKLVAENASYGDVKIEGDRVILDNMQWLADITPIQFSFMFAGGRNSKGSKYRVDLTALSSFPRRMEVGDTLPDEDILNAGYSEVLTDEEKAEREATRKQFETEVMAMSGGRVFASGPIGTSVITVRAQTRNRKVEAFEQILTPAGTFDCYKITYELIMPENVDNRFYITVVKSDAFFDSPGMGAKKPEPRGIKCADWISPEVGLVKREKYNDRGKLQEVMQLESYKK